MKMLSDIGHTPFCVVRDVEDWGRIDLDLQELMRRTFTQIRECHLVLVDLSEKGVGLGLEAGYAHARGIRVVVIAPAGCEISATLRGTAEACYNYRDEGDLKSFLAQL